MTTPEPPYPTEMDYHELQADLAAARALLAEAANFMSDGEAVDAEDELYLRLCAAARGEK